MQNFYFHLNKMRARRIILAGIVWVFSSWVKAEKPDASPDAGIVVNEQKTILSPVPSLKLASVNGCDILYRDISEFYQSAMNKAPSGQLSSPIRNLLLLNLVNQKIDERLMQNVAESQNVSVPEDKVEELFAHFKSKFTNDELYQDYLKKKGFSEEEVKQRILQRLEIKTLQEQLTGNIQVSDQEAQAFYDTHQDLINPPEAYHVSQILLTFSGTDSEKEQAGLVSKMEDVRSKLVQGADFIQMARQVSEGMTASSGGGIGWITSSQAIEPKLMDALKKMKPGELSPVVVSREGVHLLKLNDYQPPSPRKDFEKVVQEIRRDLLEKKKEDCIQSYLRDLRKKSNIQIMEGAFSEWSNSIQTDGAVPKS
jgi:peptidyl-prolyl cis-trans isomerase C